MTSDAPAPLVQALDAFVDVLSHITDETPGVDHGFYDGLCAAICRQTSIGRAVIFRYDGAHRRVRAAGAAGVDIAVFDGAFVSVEVLGEARRALEDDVVVEAREFEGIPAEFAYLVKDRVLVVAPMVAAGRWIGVVVGDRPAHAPPLEDAERHLLWTLGKTAALAAMARIATSQAHRTRDLEARIDLARDIHDGAIQRLFGVSLALSGKGDLDADSRRRCADELQAALQDLRDAVQRPRAVCRGRPARRWPPSSRGSRTSIRFSASSSRRATRTRSRLSCRRSRSRCSSSRSATRRSTRTRGASASASVGRTARSSSSWSTTACAAGVARREWG